MSRIISDSMHHLEAYYHLVYSWEDCSGAGFSFPCDEIGNVDIDSMQPEAQANYAACVRGEKDGKKLVCEGVERYSFNWKEPAVLECDCGAHVDLDGFTNMCEGCGADYNMSGQRLAPRECWGEETGEHPADIGRIP